MAGARRALTRLSATTGTFWTIYIVEGLSTESQILDYYRLTLSRIKQPAVLTLTSAPSWGPEATKVLTVSSRILEIFPLLIQTTRTSTRICPEDDRMSWVWSDNRFNYFDGLSRKVDRLLLVRIEKENSPWEAYHDGTRALSSQLESLRALWRMCRLDLLEFPWMFGQRRK